MSIGPSGTNFSEILIKVQNFSFTKMHLKVSSAKWRPFSAAGRSHKISAKFSFVTCDISAPAPPSCGNTTLARHGIIQSPGFPYIYPLNLDCEYTIMPPDTTHVILHFDRLFNLGGGGGNGGGFYYVGAPYGGGYQYWYTAPDCRDYDAYIKVRIASFL